MAGKYLNPEKPKKARLQPKQVWETVKTVFTWALMIAAVAMMIFTFISVTTVDRNDRSLFGYKAFIIRSDSMKATDFAAGDLILLREADPASLQPGDIIAYRSTDPKAFGETFTHKIRQRTVTQAGEPAFITYGTTTNVDDEYPVTYTQILGKYQLTLRGIGKFFMFLRTVPGYLCCILLVFLLLIGIQGADSVRLFRQYRKEQVALMKARQQKERKALELERQQLAADRAEAQQLLQELKEMKMQLEDRKGEVSSES